MQGSVDGTLDLTDQQKLGLTSRRKVVKRMKSKKQPVVKKGTGSKHLIAER